MTKEDLSKLIDECCDDIFDRKEPLANVKARLYYTLKKQLTLTDVVPQLVEFADWLQYNGKWSLPEQQVKDFIKEQQEQN